MNLTINKVKSILHVLCHYKLKRSFIMKCSFHVRVTYKNIKCNKLTAFSTLFMISCCCSLWKKKMKKDHNRVISLSRQS